MVQERSTGRYGHFSSTQLGVFSIKAIAIGGYPPYSLAILVDMKKAVQIRQYETDVPNLNAEKSRPEPKQTHLTKTAKVVH